MDDSVEVLILFAQCYVYQTEVDIRNRAKQHHEVIRKYIKEEDLLTFRLGLWYNFLFPPRMWLALSNSK